MRNGDVLECLLCGDRYSADDVLKGLYFASTGICKKCYMQGLKAENSIWCFGTFSVEYLECRFDCPDRKICKYFTSQKKQEISEKCQDKL